MKKWYISFILLAAAFIVNAQQSKSTSSISKYNQLSEDFLKKALLKEDTKIIQEELASLDLDQLAMGLDTDTKRIAFWVNIYNAYIQVTLTEDPGKIENKGRFFPKKQIPLFGRLISFDKIEHHILRRSQWKFGLGNFQLSFRPKFEKILRVDTREPRIHFVLNCGAKSCPTTVVLSPANLEDQLRKSTTEFLKKSTEYDPADNTVYISPILMWFRGDFGNKKGIKHLLTSEELIPNLSNPSLKKTDYDWTLDLDNWKTWNE